MLVENQSEAVSFLSQLTGFGGGAHRIQTHISDVFVYPQRVFKLKRAVRFDYLDFSTADMRLTFCQRELELNRRTAPQLYIAVRRLTQTNNGGVEFDGDGPLIDSVVEMHPFAQDDLFDAMAVRGALDAPLLEQLAHVMSRFHNNAAPAAHRSGAQAIRYSININEKAFAQSPLAGEAEVAAAFSACRVLLERHTKRLDERAANGFLRHCHGDLHLRNICLFRGAPVIFDCIEFDPQLYEIDTLFDLSFLLMDLLHRDLPQAANLVFNRYLDDVSASHDCGVTGLMIAVRALVRGQIAACRSGEGGLNDHQARQLREEAHQYLALALQSAKPRAAQLIAIGGLSGTGKSTLAAALAPFAGALPGARILSTDRIRKRMHGVQPHEKLPPQAYTQDAATRVYERQRELALRTLQSGQSVIADGVFLQTAERDAIAAAARQAGAEFQGFWLEAPVAEISRRVEARRGDPSDATARVVEQQAQRDPGPVNWMRLAAGGDGQGVFEQAKRATGL